MDVSLGHYDVTRKPVSWPPGSGYRLSLYSLTIRDPPARGGPGRRPPIMMMMIFERILGPLDD